MEIRCPSDCGYLTAAREHPAAVVRRQQERDVATLLPTLHGLSDRQHQLFFLFLRLIARHKPEGFTRLADDDVAGAAAVVAATLETAARGVIYEHRAESLPAERLATEIKALLAEIRQQGAPVSEREAAIVLRAIEQGARETKRSSGGDTAYLAMVGRLLQQMPGGDAGPHRDDHGTKSSLIVP